ncbi:MAG: hydroxymethylbilane synthase [Bacteroidetes bacterium]|nr:hydroxymethylbilane synthase [Bacteroidota bacterium]
MQRLIKIGSRDSNLALWQAKFIENLLQQQGLKTEIVLVKSEGDINLVSPLYEMGVQGIFTKNLDMALLSNKIDIAVHSLKDVPTQLPKNLTIAAIPERANVKDALVYENSSFELSEKAGITIATSSLRRKAQWLNKYPQHAIESIRGNINTRLEKLKSTPQWSGALFACAGINRIGLEVPNKLELDWMLPAPAQGALAVVCREDDLEVDKICSTLNHSETSICVGIERSFLRHLKGGCSIPIAALAVVSDKRIHFRGNILSLDGARKVEVEMEFDVADHMNAGRLAAEELLSKGGDKIALELKSLMTE